MAVQASVKPIMMDDFDDDDGPIVFRRSSTTSKQKVLNSDTKKSSFLNSDGQSGRQVSNLHSQNNQTSNLQKARDYLASKTTSIKPSSASSKGASSSGKACPTKSPVTNSKAMVSSDDRSKYQSKLKTVAPSKEEKQSVRPAMKRDYHSEDSEDDKPLSSRISPGLSKSKSNHDKKSIGSSSLVSPPLPKPKVIKYIGESDDEKPLRSTIQPGLSKSKSSLDKKSIGSSSLVSPPLPKPKVNKYTDDSDDEKPLSSALDKNSNARASTSKYYDSDDNKPLVSTIQQNGSSTRDNQLKKCSTVLNKRPIGDIKCSDQSTVKKPRVSDASTQFRSNSSSVKAEPVVDHVKSSGQPLVKRQKLSDASTPTDTKPASAKSEPKVDNFKSASVRKPSLSDASVPINSKPASTVEKSNVYEDDDDDDGDHIPISQRIKKPVTSSNKVSSAKQKGTTVSLSSSKKIIKKSKKVIKKTKYSTSTKVPPSSGEGQKWTTLVHNGVIFPPPYNAHGVNMLYKGRPVDLTPEQEEVATMYAVMLDTDYMNKSQFKENFMNDWRKILGKNHVIQKLEDCDFTPIYEWHQKEKEKKKQMSTEEKKAIKEEKMKQEEKYMWAIVDGVKEKVGNFRVEPPGLFRGRGEHPKMGKLKRRIRPSDITINIGKDAPVPECPIRGQGWKEVKHDNTVTWLAFWNDPINPREFKYVFLAASSSLKGQSDKEKYEKSRLLKDYIQGIRAAYTKDFVSKDVTKRQIAVATYLIDKLALRAGNEKDDDEADTVGCCTLKVENVEPEPPNTLKFDFLGKDSIRYQNEVEVELPVYKAIQQFRTGKKGGDDLFDKLDTSKLNAHLKGLMPGLTAKVFRTYNASITLDEMLNRETKVGDVAENVAIYQHANKEVAIICNHQRTVSKSHSAQMTRLNEKIDELKGILDELNTDLVRARKGKPPLKGSDGKPKKNLTSEALEKKVAQTRVKIEKLERDKDTKEDLKTVALGTSKINYLDPRITVAWCKRHEVPIEKMFNKSLLAKFAWAMDVDPSFRF